MSQPAPAEYRYLETHEWHDIQGDVATIGITQFAADELTDITYVALPKVGTAVKANQRFAEIESVKATSDLYSGVTGVVTAVNRALEGNPGLVNTDPYKEGWIVKVKMENPAEVEKLLILDDYLKKTGH